MLVRLRDSYVLDAGDLIVSVTPGEGQKAYVELLLDGKLVGSGASIADLRVGSGAELAGRRLRATATVTDTNPRTNNTSVTFLLRSDRTARSWSSAHTVDVEGATVDYDAIFVLL